MVKPGITRKKRRPPGAPHYAPHLDMLQLRPSERINLDQADRLGAAHSRMRPMIPIDTPFLYRILYKTAQRVPLHYSSLNSSSAFILVCDEEREAVGWYGQDCSLEDRKYATELGLQVLRFDLRKEAAVHFPFSSEATPNQRILRFMLPKLWCDEATYMAKKVADARRRVVYNAPVTIGCVDKYLDGSCGLREVAFATSDTRGAVPRLDFVPVELNTVAVLTYGDQWDIWVARGVSAADEKIAVDYITKLAALRSEQVSIITSVAKNPNVRVTKQGCERVLFREHLRMLTEFEPPGKTLVWTPPQVGAGLGGGVLDMMGDPLSDSVNALGRLGGVVGDALTLDTASRALGDVMGALTFGVAGGGREDGNPASEKEQAAGRWLPPPPPSAADEKNSGVAGAGAGKDSADKDKGGAQQAQSRLSVINFFGRSSLPPSGVNQTLTLPPPPTADGAAAPDAAKGGTGHVAAKDVPPPNKVVMGKKKTKFAGRDMLSYDMMDFHDELSVGATKSQSIIETTMYEPLVLVGYQIEIDEGPYAGRYVVTGTKKTVFQKSLFRISNFELEDDWVKLKRGPKAGLPFRVLRKVFDPN